MNNLTLFYTSRWEKILSSGLDISTIDSTLVYDRKADKQSHFDIVFIGEAPGAEEVTQGKPFVGAAGKNLRGLIDSANLSSSWLIINAFPFRTFKEGAKGSINRTPTSKEIAIGALLLKEELSLIKPRVVVLLGRSAHKAFTFYPDTLIRTETLALNFNDFLPPHDTRPFWLGLTTHPSPLMYNRPAIKASMRNFFSQLGVCDH